MDKIGKFTLIFLSAFILVGIILVLVALSSGWALTTVIILSLAVATVIIIPLTILTSLIGIIKILRTRPRYNCWKSAISLVLSLILFFSALSIWIQVRKNAEKAQRIGFINNSLLQFPKVNNDQRHINTLQWTQLLCAARN